MELRASLMGTNWPHDPGQIWERPDGFDEFLFLHFRTRMEVRTAHGIEKCPPGSCLVYEPWHPQWYRGDGVTFRDDWCHVSGSDVRPLLAESKVPLNTILSLKSTRFYPKLIEEMLREKHRQEPLSEQVIGTLIAKLILLIGRGIAEGAQPQARGREQRTEDLRHIRQQVQDNLGEAWTVARMAELAGLGENRFAVLYRQCFGVSPVEDLIQARLRHAQWLLGNLHTSVGAVAAECGFRDIHYFSRLFRRRVGCSPSEFVGTRRHSAAPRQYSSTSSMSKEYGAGAAT